MTTRREFLAGATLSAAAAACIHADPLGLPIGFQSWPMRQQIAQDFPGTLRQLAEVGYRRVEMCSPPGYIKYGFGPLAGLKASEMRRIIAGAGLGCESCHFNRDELTNHLDERIAFAKELGLKQMILASFGIPPDGTLDDWRRSAEWLNTVGEKVQSSGIQLGYHNHDFEFKKYGDALVYDELMKTFDPKFIKMQFQVAVISLGYDAADFLTKYPGRFISLHCADWSPTEKKVVPLGQGIVNWPRVFTAARIGGIKNYFVEVDNLQETKASYPYVHNLNV